MIDRRSVRVLGTLAAIAFLAVPRALGFTAIVAFGDSYTDTGRSPSSPPDYYDGRFSNGRLWIEYFSQTLGFSYNSANNYAVSGTESDELFEQIDKFPGTTDSTGVLFAIWSGNNDFQGHLDNGEDDAAWDASVAHTISSLCDSCVLLYQKGARNVVVFNQVDITQMPQFTETYSTGYGAYLRGKIQNLNSQLDPALSATAATNSGLQITVVDAYDQFNTLLNNYQSYGFVNDTIGAINDPNLPNISFNGPGANYVFWDSEHPTTKTHALVAGWVANTLGITGAPADLTVEVQGNGSVSPNYNGQELVVGKNYTMTAVPKAGFAFEGWADQSGTSLTMDAKLIFTMASDLTLVATFADVTAPTITVASPGASVNQQTITVKGTAKDNVGVAAVYCQINGGGYQTVSSDNNYLNWYTSFDLVGGVNSLQFYSVDTSGNQSKVVSLNVTYITSSLLTLATNGVGKITPTYAGQYLVVGKAYSISAVPGANYLFSSWTATGPDGSVTYTNSLLKFDMQSNFDLTANFVTNSFLEADGVYNGLFSVADTGPTETTSGELHSLKITSLGVFSGQVLVGGVAYGMSGRLAVDGTGTFTIQRAKALGPLVVQLALNFDSQQLTGSVSGSDNGGWTANLTAELESAQGPAGTYTMLLPIQDTVSGVTPSGDGYASIVSRDGVVTVSGALADGTAFSESVTVSASGDVPIYANLYAHAGLLIGWINLGGGTSAGNLVWIRPAAKGTSVYAGGFTSVVQAQLSPWTAPSAGQAAVPLNSGQLSISGSDGNAPQLSFNVAVNAKSQLVKVDDATTNTLTGSINPKTGLWTIAFGNGTGRATTAGRGAFLQSTASAGGYFLSTTSAGSITVAPSE